MDLCGGYTKETAEYTNRIFTVKKGYHRGADEPEEDYDLLTVIVIRQGEKTEEKGIFDLNYS